MQVFSLLFVFLLFSDFFCFCFTFILVCAQLTNVLLFFFYRILWSFPFLPFFYNLTPHILSSPSLYSSRQYYTRKGNVTRCFLRWSSLPSSPLFSLSLLNLIHNLVVHFPSTHVLLLLKWITAKGEVTRSCPRWRALTLDPLHLPPSESDPYNLVPHFPDTRYFTFFFRST